MDLDLLRFRIPLCGNDLCGRYARSTASGGRTTRSPAISQGSLTEACEHAKADFHPITETDVAEAKAVLMEALGRLDERLTEAGANGDGWRKYLHWDVLQDSLRADNKHNLARLTRIHAFFTRGYDGLELAWFLDAQHALENYVVMASVVGSPQVRAGMKAD